MAESEQEKVYVRGLEGISAGETLVSYVDGVNGILVYRGYNIHEIADRISFDECIYLLWEDDLPTEEERKHYTKHLIGEMKLPQEVIDILKIIPRSSHPMATLRTAVSALGTVDPHAEDISRESLKTKSFRLTGQVMAIVAAMYRIENNLPILEPDLCVDSVSANFLYLFNGRWPTAEEIKAVDSIFVLHADHGFNASTFAARVTTSTLSDIYSALTTAIGALKGPLHGGANQKVMEMLMDIGHTSKVKEYIEGMLNDRKKIMGFGHRVYKVEDPRAKHLRIWAEELTKQSGNEHLYQIAMEIEKIVIEKKGIYPNVDFYSAVVQHCLGIPKDYYTTIFAIARTPGWLAHVMEQHEDNRLIRPTSRYEGPMDNKYVPVEIRQPQADRKASKQ